MSGYVGKHRAVNDDGSVSITLAFGRTNVFGTFGLCEVTPTPENFPGRHATPIDVAIAAIRECSRIVRDGMADMPPLDFSQGPPRRRRWFE